MEYIQNGQKQQQNDHIHAANVKSFGLQIFTPQPPQPHLIIDDGLGKINTAVAVTIVLCNTMF